MKFTTEKISEIAHASKKCHPEGLGLWLRVYADGTIHMATGHMDSICRGDGHGGWEYPILSISNPQSQRSIRGIVEAIKLECLS